MKNDLLVFLLLSVICFFAAGLFLSAHALAQADAAVGVKIMEKEVLGKFLADGRGISLYSFSRDTENTSSCIEGCAVNWPPFYADPSAAVEGCETVDFFSITRSDGRHQTTYKGMPLYYFKDDKYPGDTFGHGIGDVWFLVVP